MNGPPGNFPGGFCYNWLIWDNRNKIEQKEENNGKDSTIDKANWIVRQFVTVQSQADFHAKVWIMLAWMNTFTWKSIWRIRHTDEMRSILEVVLNSYSYFICIFAFPFSFVKQRRQKASLQRFWCRLSILFSESLFVNNCSEPGKIS